MGWEQKHTIAQITLSKKRKIIEYAYLYFYDFV